MTGVFSRTDTDRTTSAGVGTSGTDEGDGSRLSPSALPLLLPNLN